MKHGCMIMTVRLSSSRRSGSRQIHRGRKKRVKFAALSSPCWSFFFRHPRHCPQGIRTPWSNRKWQVLLWGFEAAEGGHSAQTSRQLEKNNWFLHHDNAPAHTSLIVRHFLTSKNITVIPHPVTFPHSPDLAPCKLFLFPKMKLRLKGRRFDTTEEIHAETHYVQRYRSPSTYPPQQQDTICCKNLSLTLLMMGKILPETCWAIL